jgi:hypothetical protein
MRICSGKSISGKITSLLLAAAVSSPLLMTGCEVHGRVYDSYDHQYRQWAPESSYYTEWENDTHRRRESYERRSREEQQEYWQWRHRRDRDHDHDNDRH